MFFIILLIESSVFIAHLVQNIRIPDPEHTTRRRSILCPILRLLIITPGIRPHGSASGDQKRIATPQDAFQAGADYIVVGRPITQSSQPVKVVDQILAEIASQ